MRTKIYVLAAKQVDLLDQGTGERVYGTSLWALFQGDNQEPNKQYLRDVPLSDVGIPKGYTGPFLAEADTAIVNQNGKAVLKLSGVRFVAPVHFVQGEVKNAG